jgi:UDPglucose 6-dehydrogenase
VLVTELDEFRNLDLAALAPLTASRILVDGRNAIQPEAATRAGFDYTGIGRYTRSRSPELRAVQQ